MAKRKAQEWRKGKERSGGELQEVHPSNRQKEVNAGSWRGVGRNHQAVNPSRVPKGNAETIRDLMKLSGQRRCKFPCTSEAQTHQGKKAKSKPGRDLQNTKGTIARRDASTWRGGTVQKP